MTQQKEIYKCSICGNIVEVLHTGAGQLVCCGQPMDLFEEKTKDEGFEKHVPVIKETETGIRVEVGSIPHPMAEDHFIEWIEVIKNKKSCKKFLKPGEKPESEFNINREGAIVREYCSVHGLWVS